MDRALARFRAGLAWWVDFVRRRAGAVIALALAATVALGWYTVSAIGINTSTTDMLSPDLPFRQDASRMSQAFPQLSNQIVVVIDGRTVVAAEDAAAALAEALRGRTDVVRSVFYAEGDPFFRRNGLLYLDTAKLSDLIDRLAGAQAFLGKLWRDPSLRGLFDVLALALDNTGDTAPPAGLDRVLNAMAAAAEAQVAGRPGVVSWQAILEGDEPDAADRRRILDVQPVLDYGSLAPADRAIDAIRGSAAALGLTPANGVTVRLTGSAPLEEEELATAVQGVSLAGALSSVLVIGLLLWGVQSTRLALATIVTVFAGLVWSAGFAALTIGTLNLISVAFAVLFIGLSDEFGVHFALRVRESIVAGQPLPQAIREAGADDGPATALCAVAAAIAFYSFLPTDYIGLAELGLIAGTSMFVALFANLTLLPALIALMPPRRPAPRPNAGPARRRSPSFAVRHARPIAVGALVLGIGSLALAPAATFDFDPLNLKDPNTESMRTLFDLMQNGRSGLYSIEILADDLEKAQVLAHRLEALPEVEDAATLADYVPKDQDAKLTAIDQAALFLLPAFQGKAVRAPADAERRTAFEKFRTALAARAREGNSALRETNAAIRRLDGALAGIEATPHALAELERRLVGTLPHRLAELRDALEAGPVAASDLPKGLRDRMVAADGRARIEVRPQADLRDRAALERFVAAVRSIAPHATGSPVVIVEAGQTVIRAFLKAGAISIIAIGILIALLLRRARDVALVFAPLVLAGALTVATAVLLGLPFNFANVIVLPLLFGLGVSSAIHLVLRARHTADLGDLFATSTPRAVAVSVLTTIGSFASMALSAHRGTASMGVLLTIAVGLTLATTLIVLPALMAIFGVNGGSRKRTT